MYSLIEQSFQQEPELISTCTDSSTSIVLHIRPLEEKDRDQIKLLHEELFPVQYTEDFYDNAVRNISMNGHPLYSRVVVKSNKDGQEGQMTSSFVSTDRRPKETIEESMIQLARSVDLDADIFRNIKVHERIKISDPNRSKINGTLREYAEIESGGNSNGDVVRPNNNMVGCIIGGFFYSNQINDEKIRNLLVRNTERYPRMFYIMTLGTTKSFRHQKLGTKLVKDCINMVEYVPTCGIVYLHVITYNQAAIQFYEKLGFYRIEEIKDYYLIDGVKYNCYLYAYYVNGEYQQHIMIIPLEYD